MALALTYLSADPHWFPSPEQALTEPNGLLAIGGDLKPERLLMAYRHGIFPWFNPGEPILWWSPDPRTVFEVGQFQPSKSLKKAVRQNRWYYTVNHAFTEVIAACAAPRASQDGTWISDQIQQAYIQLHQQGHAHSIEVWQGEQLIGGLYGLTIGRVFCGESMFHRVSNASKAAFWALHQHVSAQGFHLIDAQVANCHLTSLGAKQINRTQFLAQLRLLRDHPHQAEYWQKARYTFDGTG